uniref:40S ribosomal protein S29 n=1 Tax=Chromera velia CCMP2878 TaxID=1169474 RepID=A0A0G4HFT3_9ALVE|eukprot:Cvel_6702.t1-p1 / transcript=Cvel_6702.t1 / gene=Cvel_6702 / organism=Chromera_velia_CCMP2878 / gene_product=40S ribosomal protein S29, putative / transcript_product=40S ribosomal protein S29, putative / location=Cvel_scaffold334:26196-36244(-) / protein_length=130 / sequence_SO=supercontig / SO=protein_coding / is_pseudo=false
MPSLYNARPKDYGPGGRRCKVCSNRHGLIRKYGLDICRQCFRERATQIGFVKRATQKEKGIEPPHSIYKEESFLVETRETRLLAVEVPAILRIGTYTWRVPAEDRATHSSITSSDDWDHHTGDKVYGEAL